MKIRTYLVTATLILMVMIFRDSNAAAYNMAEYIPLNQGNEWTYSLLMTFEGGETEGEFGPLLSKTAVNGTEMINQVETVKVERRTPASSKEIPDYECFTLGTEGLKLFKERSVNYIGSISVFEQGILMMPAQFDVGEINQQSASYKLYDADGTFVGTDTGNVTNSIASVEDVSTPAGNFKDCLKIDGTQTNDSLTFRREAHYWRAREVGMVKSIVTDHLSSPEEGEISITLKFELVSATVNGVSYGQCPAVFALGGATREHDLNTLRKFRDEVLHKTPEGRQIIKLYYQLGPAAVQAMKEDEAFKDEVKELIEGVLPLLR